LSYCFEGWNCLSRFGVSKINVEFYDWNFGCPLQ
jgi:hypothetical protein